jgi:hypothetical protein
MHKAHVRLLCIGVEKAAVPYMMWAAYHIYCILLHIVHEL